MGSESHDKRQRERHRQERSAAKRARRDARTEGGKSDPAVDTDVIMERFRVLSEQFAAGAITRERYDAQRVAIFNELGLEATT